MWRAWNHFLYPFAFISNILVGSWFIALHESLWLTTEGILFVNIGKFFGDFYLWIRDQE